MDIAPWLVNEFFHYYEGTVTTTPGSGPFVTADPARIYIAFFQPAAGSLFMVPGTNPSALLGYSIPTYQNFLEFFFKDTPTLVTGDWSYNSTGLSHAYFRAITYKPDF